MAALTAEQKRFLEQPYVGAITTVRPDGSPHTTVVWMEPDDGGIAFNTAVGRAKERYLRANPTASLIVVDPQDPYRWVSVSGSVELTTDGADPQIDRLAKKYIGKDEYPNRTPEEQRISVRVRADMVDSAGFDS